jgi:hypothetical protein
VVASPFWPAGGTPSDRIGRVRSFPIGYGPVFVRVIPLFLLLRTRDIVLFGGAIAGLGAGALLGAPRSAARWGRSRAGRPPRRSRRSRSGQRGARTAR